MGPLAHGMQTRGECLVIELPQPQNRLLHTFQNSHHVIDKPEQ
jgi:hypothetical protein